MGRQKTVITCAITGAIHTPTMSDALPFTYDDIAAQAIAAAEAGASILHLHARDNKTGAPSVDVRDFAPFLPRIKQATDAVVNISTGGSLTLSIQDRITPAKTFSPEMCSMNMGSLNFSFHPLANRYSDDDWKFDWEKDYVAGSDGNIFRNTFRDIKEAAETLAPHGIKFEHECYDVGHLYNLKFCMDMPPSNRLGGSHRPLGRIGVETVEQSTASLMPTPTHGCPLPWCQSHGPAPRQPAERKNPRPRLLVAHPPR